MPERQPLFIEVHETESNDEVLDVGSDRAVRNGGTTRIGVTALLLVAAVGAGFAAGRATAHRTAPATAAVVAASRSISTVVLVDQYDVSEDGSTQSCTGNSPFVDVYVAAPVVITNPSGRIVGARLGDGHPSGNQCAFPLNVTVPADWGWYVVQVGLHESRAMTLSQLATTPIKFD